MGHFTSLEEAREFFSKDQYAAISGIVLESFNDEEVIASMEIRDIHRNGLGGVMGGAIFTLGDFAFAVACNNNHCPSVAINVSINYLSSILRICTDINAQRIDRRSIHVISRSGSQR